MGKYKVGDKVKIRSWESMEEEFGVRRNGNIDLGGECFVREMKKYCGKTCIIANRSLDGKYSLKGMMWAWTEKMFEEKEQSIHITRKGNDIHAILKENGEVIKRSKAICCKEETFDFEYGSKLAVDRLFDDEKEEARFKSHMVLSHNNKYISDIGVRTNMTLSFGTPLYTGDVVEVYDISSSKILGERIICGNDFIMGSKGVSFKNGNNSSGKSQIRKVQSYKDLKNNQIVGNVAVKLKEE